MVLFLYTIKKSKGLSVFSSVLVATKSLFIFCYLFVFVAWCVSLLQLNKKCVCLKIMFMYANIGTTLRACLRERRTREQD